jgi:hypothetical protein
MSTIGPWTDLEGHVGLWCASFPVLNPLIRIVCSRLGFGSTMGAPNPSTVASSSHWNTIGRRYDLNGSGVDTNTDNDSERAIVAESVTDNPIEMTSHICKRTEIQMVVEDGPRGKRLQQDYGHATGRPSNNWVDV